MNNYNEDKIKYLKLLNMALAPLQNFDCLQYKTASNTGGEYIRMYDTIGNAYYLDVTGLDLEHVFLEVVATAIGNEPSSRVKDIYKCRIINKLFKEG